MKLLIDLCLLAIALYLMFIGFFKTTTANGQWFWAGMFKFWFVFGISFVLCIRIWQI